jgi:hypothetical protein
VKNRASAQFFTLFFDFLFVFAYSQRVFFFGRETCFFASKKNFEHVCWSRREGLVGTTEVGCKSMDQNAFGSGNINQITMTIYISVC